MGSVAYILSCASSVFACSGGSEIAAPSLAVVQVAVTGNKDKGLFEVAVNQRKEPELIEDADAVSDAINRDGGSKRVVIVSYFPKLANNSIQNNIDRLIAVSQERGSDVVVLENSNYFRPKGDRPIRLVCWTDATRVPSELTTERFFADGKYVGYGEKGYSLMLDEAATHDFALVCVSCPLVGQIEAAKISDSFYRPMLLKALTRGKAAVLVAYRPR